MYLVNIKKKIVRSDQNLNLTIQLKTQKVLNMINQPNLLIQTILVFSIQFFSKDVFSFVELRQKSTFAIDYKIKSKRNIDKTFLSVFDATVEKKWIGSY